MQGRCVAIGDRTIGLNGTTPPGGGWVPDGGQGLGLTMLCFPLWLAGVAWLGLGWNPLIGMRLGPSADEQRACPCARAHASCQWGSSRATQEGYS